MDNRFIIMKNVEGIYMTKIFKERQMDGCNNDNKAVFLHILYSTGMKILILMLQAYH